MRLYRSVRRRPCNWTAPDTIRSANWIRASGHHSLYCSPVLNPAGRLLGMVMVYGRREVEFAVELKERVRDVSTLFAMGVEHRFLTERLTYQAHHDTLTSLPNRTFFYQLLQDSLLAARQQQHKVAVLWADLDRFKQINDSLGHRSADLLLQTVAQRLTQCVESRGVVARMGGDEFVILMREISDAGDAATLASDIVSRFRDPFTFCEHSFPLGISVGVSVFPDHADDAESLVRNADLAMYGAKHLGRNTFVCFTPEKDSTTLQTFQMEFHLRRALDLQEFELYYQPIVSSKDGAVVALEALLRWFSPELGSVSPAQFIPVAEASGLMTDIGRWVVERACMDAAAWQEDGPNVAVSVNVSATQLSRGGFEEIVGMALKQSGLPARLLELELTESAIIGLADYRRHTEALRNLGVSLAIDDFGTGYSSLSYLHALRVDTLKMDRSFVSSMTAEATPARLAETILAMARTLGLRVVAEGIETQEQLHWLTDLECDLLQGYFIHKPMPVASVRGILRGRHPVFTQGSL